MDKRHLYSVYDNELDAAAYDDGVELDPARVIPVYMHVGDVEEVRRAMRWSLVRLVPGNRLGKIDDQLRRVIRWARHR